MAYITAIIFLHIWTLITSVIAALNLLLSPFRCHGNRRSPKVRKMCTHYFFK